MKEFVSEPGNANINDPNIKFFVERNPDWSKGHQLLTLSSVDFTDILRLFYRVLLKVFVKEEQDIKRSHQPVQKKQMRLSEFVKKLNSEHEGAVKNEENVPG